MTNLELLVVEWATLREMVALAKAGRSNKNCVTLLADLDPTVPLHRGACRWQMAPVGDPERAQLPESDWCEACRQAERSHEKFRELRPKLTALTRRLCLAGLDRARRQR